jgi:TonB-linked SusC/RagA family outer membrane protein
MKTKFSGILTLFLAFVVQLTFAQEKSISGTISDENGLPMPGVSVLVDGTSNGTQTDFDGNYSLSASTGDVIRYSSIGYKTVDKTVGTSNNISFDMEVDVTAIDEVVITALGIKRKKDAVTGAYQEVKTEELAKANNPDVVKGLAGKVSGLQITQNSNGVGSGGTRIVLRGNRSISGNNQALVVIDGAISDTGFLNALDPNQIETVNVIKGASGAALYGQQGSNGVIVVTTKKVSKDASKMTVSVNSSLDFENVSFVPERQTRYGQGWDLGNGFENVIYENGGWGPEFDGQTVPVGLPQADGTFITAPYSSRGSDHIKEFFSTGLTRQNSFSIASGDADGYVKLGARNVNRGFIIEGDNRKQNTLTFNAGKTAGKWTVGADIIYTNASIDRHNGSLYTQLLQSASNIPITAFANSGNEGHWNAYFTNPYWNLANQRSETESNRLSLQGTVSYQVNDNISFKLLSNARLNDSNALSYQNAYDEPQDIINNTGANRSIASSFNYNLSRSSTYYTDFFVNLDYMLTDDISFSANVGMNNQYVKFSSANSGGSGLTIPGLYTSTNISNVANVSSSDSRGQNASIGVFGNFEFGYKDYLYLNLTGRRDWTSVLSKQNQAFNYPSASVSFVPTKAIEGLKSNVLNYMKITAGYTSVGNGSQVGTFAINPLLNQAPGFPLGGQNSFVVDRSITDPFINPEFIDTQEFGINLGMFNDRITLDASYSLFQGRDQITRINTSASSGLSSIQLNIAESEGTALELDLGIKVIKTDDINFDVNIGYANNENKVLSVSDQSDSVSLGGFTGFAEVFAIAGENYPVIQTNYYERDPQGRVLINPNSGNPIEASGLKIAGRTTPKHTVNLNTSFRYKDFTLSATMDYRTGHVFYSDTKSNLTWSGHAVETAQGGRGAFIWPNSAIETSPGVFEANTSVPSGGSNAGSYISFFNLYRGIGENHVLDATAFKVRELSLRYDLNPEFLKNTFVSGLSISATARNPFIILPTENRGYNDPETGFTTGNAQGITTQAGSIPATRTFGLGLNVTF